MTKKKDNLYQALERLANHASCGIGSGDTDIMNPSYFKKEMRQLKKDVNLFCKFIEENM